MRDKLPCECETACATANPDSAPFTAGLPPLPLRGNLDLLTSAAIVTANLPHVFLRSSPPPVFDSGATALSDHERLVTQWYVFLLDRLPDLGGLQYWAGELDAGRNPDDLMASLFNAAVGTTIYRDLGANADFITAAYWHVLGRSPDAEGAAYWLARMPDASVASRLDILQQFMAAAFAAEDGTWAKTFAQDRLAMCSEAVAQQRASDQAASGKVLQIDCFGDSTSFGYDGVFGTRVGMPMPESLQLALNLQSPRAVVVNNLGVNSTTAADLLAGTNGHAPFANRLAASTADMVVFNFGLNEAYRDNSPQSMHDALAELVRLATAAGKSVVISTMNPVTPDIAWQAQVADMHAVALQVARESASVADDEYAAIQDLPDWPAGLPDGVHPVQDLYATKAAGLATEILPGLVPVSLQVVGVAPGT